MHYQISRNGQTYGPYTLEDLQRYVASGNVLPTDMAKSEEMTDWVPVSQLLAPPAAVAAPPMSDPGFSSPGFSNPGFANSGYANPVAQPYAQQMPLAGSIYADAPNLNWGLVILFSFLTCGLFMVIWNLVVAAWLRRVQPNANSLFFYLGAIVIIFFNMIVGGMLSAHTVFNPGDKPSLAMLGPYLGMRMMLWFVLWVVRLVARYSQRASLEEHFNTVEPVGLQLNPVMTFFFGGIYFQYHLNRINQMKQAARFGAGRGF